MDIIVRQISCIVMPIKTETIWKKFTNCFKISLPITNSLKMYQIKHHIDHVKIDIHEGGHISILYWIHIHEGGHISI